MASVDEIARLLERTPMFHGLSPSELDELAKVAVPRRYEAGQVVFREGDEGDTCFVIRSGAVKITREHGGRTIALAELRAGDTFGELSMFGGEVRSASAQTLEATQAVALLAGDIRRLLAGNPEIALKMLETMANRVRATNLGGDSAFSVEASATTSSGSDVLNGIVGMWRFDENTGTTTAKIRSGS